MRVRLRGLPILWQTLGLVLAALVVAQLLFFAVFIFNPPPRPQFNRIQDIAATLKKEPHEQNDRLRPLVVHEQPSEPAPRDKMVLDEQQTHALAERIGVADDQVRFYVEPERNERRQPFRGWREPMRVHRGDTLFFSPVVTGLRTQNGWRIAQTPPPPLLAPWQLRMLLWLLLSAVALTPLAWLFARALARPIHRFAEAAERLGADPGAPPVVEDGPAELRTTARALNAMQTRVTGYIAERTEMIGAIAHDLRTPLARIAFRIEAADEPMREKVLADVEQMRAMLAATIAFVKGMGGDRQRIDVDLTALLRAIVEQDADLGRPVTMGATASVAVRGDPLMLERLFQNLIDNGVAYGGAVEVAVAGSDGKAIVSVLDRGRGLSEDMLSRAFQPFVRGEPSRNRSTGGIGLGLSIARTIAEEHGGDIALLNRQGGGLEARVTLPLAG